MVVDDEASDDDDARVVIAGCGAAICSRGVAGAGSCGVVGGGGFATLEEITNFALGMASGLRPLTVSPTRRKREGGNDLIWGVVHLVHASANISVKIRLLISEPVCSSHHRGPRDYTVECNRAPALEDLVQCLVDACDVWRRDVHDPFSITAPAQHVRVESARVPVSSPDDRFRNILRASSCRAHKRQIHQQSTNEH